MEIVLFVAVCGGCLLGGLWLIHRCGYAVSISIHPKFPFDPDDDGDDDMIGPHAPFDPAEAWRN